MKPLFQLTLLAATLVSPLAQAVADTTVYVPLGSAGEVLVIDADRDTVVGTIADLPDVHGLASAADGDYLVAGQYAGVTTGEAPVPTAPEGMSKAEHEAHHAKPAAPPSAPAEALSFVSVIRADDGSIVRRIEVPGAVHHTAVTPDGRHAVATHPNQGGISVIDLSAFRALTTVETGPSANYAVFGPDGGRVYVSNAGNNTVSEIDTRHWVVRRNFETGASPEHMVLSPDGATLYVNNVDDGTVSEISLRQGTAVRTFEIGGALHGIDVSQDGRTLFVNGRGENKLVAIELASGRMRSTPLAPSPYHLAVIDGTGKLYVSSAEEPKLWVVDQESLRVLSEIPIRGEGHQMVVVQQ